MIKLDEKTQDILIKWTYQLITCKNFIGNTLEENKHKELDYEISENIRKVLIHLKPEELILPFKDKKEPILLYYFLYIFNNIISPSLPTHIQISLFQALNTWFSRCIQCIELFPLIRNDMINIYTNFVSEKMYNFIWERWEVNTIQNILREFFTKMLSFQKAILSQDDLKKSLNKILYKALNENISIKASTYVIDTLIKILGIESILSIEPDFFIVRILFLRDTALAPALSRMLINFLTTLRYNLSQHFEENLNEVWIDNWFPHIMDCFCKKDTILEQNITKWFFPGILRQSIECYKIIIDKLKNNKQLNSDQYLYLLITILKVGNDLNTFQEFNDQTLKTFGLLQNTISNLLNSLSASHRISVLSLIVEGSKFSTPISFNNLNLIMVNLPKIIIDSDANSRDCIVEIINKILIKLCISSNSFLKKLKKINQHETLNKSKLENILTNIESFILWLYNFLKNEMLPGLSYTRVITALNITKKLINIGVDPSIPLDFKRKFKVNLHFSLKIFDVTMVRILTDQFTNVYEEPQKLAMELLCMSPFPVDGLTQQEELTVFFNRSLELIRSNRAINAQGGAKALLFIFEKIIKHQGIIKTENLVSEINILDSPIKMIQTLIEELDNAISVGSRNLLLAANSFPLHGNLLALKYILNSVHSNLELYVETKNDWIVIYNKLIYFCQDIWKIVNSILSNDSFETFPLEDIKYISISEKNENNEHFMRINNSELSLNQLIQIILTYAWRAIKEVSALLAIILSRPSDKMNQFPKAIYEEYVHGGKLFKEWLMYIRHPGAISTIYSNFIIICSSIFASPQKELNSLPKTWLQETMYFLKKKSSFITRRSGGLPYCITAILASEIDDAHPLLSKTIEELIDIAEFNNLHGKENINVPQIHAYNTLRIIFLEKKLSNISIKFIERGFILSINGFKSNIWAIRNSSTMLFNALLTRAFGNRKHKQDYCPTTKTISTKIFFDKYPRLKKFLLEQLRDYVHFDKYNSDILYIGLNPILTLISYLEVPANYSDHTRTDMDEFISLLNYCSKSRIWKVREISAKAMPAIVSPSMCITTIINILECCKIDVQNTLHGDLLKIKYLIKSWVNHLNSKNIYHIKELKAFYTTVANVLIEKFDYIVINNRCAITKSLVLEIIFAYFIKYNWIEEKISIKFKEIALTEETIKLCSIAIKFCINLFQSEDHCQKVIGRDLFLKQASTILLYGLENFSQEIKEHVNPQIIIINLLENTDYDVRLSILGYLRYTTKAILISSTIIFKIFTIIFEEEWIVLKRDAALSLFNLLNISSFSFLNVYTLKVMMARIIFLLEDLDNFCPKDAILLLTSALMCKLWYTEPKEIYWEQFNIWIKYLDLNSNDDIDLIKRMSVIQSLKCFTEHLILNNISTYSSQQLEYIIPIYFILLKLLKDDSQEIRELASEIVSQIISEKTVFSSVYSSELLLNHLSIIYKSSFLFKEKLLNSFINFENINEFQDIISHSQKINLFIHEKKNLWKDNIRDNFEIIKILALLNDDDGYIINKLTLWANSFAKILLQTIVEKGYDGHMGWTSNGDIYNIISKLLHIVQYLESVSNKQNVLYEELKELIKKITIEAERNNVHKCLFDSKMLFKQKIIQNLDDC
ncbi:hypothetical protein PCANB_001644 [Pneumocystis canis]|nr:hypothetical protein PCANB_001644 [Pneumocystis canis]